MVIDHPAHRGNVPARKVYKSFTRWSGIFKSCSIGNGLGPRRPVKGYDMTILQTVLCHIAGMGALCYWIRKFFKQSDRLAGHVGEGLRPHSVGM